MGEPFIVFMLNAKGAETLMKVLAEEGWSLSGVVERMKNRPYSK